MYGNITEKTDWEPKEPEKKKSVADEWIADVRIGIGETEPGPEDRCVGVTG